MLIAGFTPLSLVDFPGQACAVIFTQGCNLQCPFCHNRDLIPFENQTPLLSWEFVCNRLEARKQLVSAVVVSGGEPTLQKDLPQILQDLRRREFRIKLDTNGTHPGRLRELLHEGLVDYVALDVKAPFDARMQGAMGRKDFACSVQESLAILSRARVAYEIRTTCHNEIDDQALYDMACQLPIKAKWVLQKCRSHERYESFARSIQWSQDLVHELKKKVPDIHLRGWDCSQVPS